MKESLITSADELFQYLNDVKERYYFRGFSNYDWHMLPSLGRYNDEIIRDEIKLIQEFAQISALEELDVKAANLHELVEIGQHYGLPTRLLDWTTNPYVALFFAIGNHIRPSNSYSIAAILRDNPGISHNWNVIDNLPVSQNTLGDLDLLTLDEMDYLLLGDVDEFELFKSAVLHPLFERKFYDLLNTMDEKMLITYQVTPFNERMTKQNGLFSIHKDVSKAIPIELLDSIISFKLSNEDVKLVLKILDQKFSVNRKETFPDPVKGSPIEEIKNWCEEKKNMYKTK